MALRGGKRISTTLSLERGGRGDKRGEQQHRAHPRLISERVLQLARHERSVLRESAAGDATSSSTLRLVWSEQSCRLRFDKPKWLTMRKFRPSVSDLLTSFTALSENASGIGAGRTRETSERRGARPNWERRPGCDPTLAASHGDRVFATRSTHAVWPRLFVQLLPPLQMPRSRASRTAPRRRADRQSRPDFDGSRSTRRQRAGLASCRGLLRQNLDFLATTVGADSRGQGVDHVNRVSPLYFAQHRFLPGTRPPPSTRSRAQAWLHPQEKEIEVRGALLHPPSSVCSGRTRWGVSTRRALWQTEDEAGGSQGAGQDVGVEEGRPGPRYTLQSLRSKPSFVSRQQDAWETRWEQNEGAGLPGSRASEGQHPTQGRSRSRRTS
ncbi:hypothetical protein OF846_000282 [Rhodotorula toruloides]|nr:hypothetical protein OF846_000282 [Rhodotorula toruloides]